MVAKDTSELKVKGTLIADLAVDLWRVRKRAEKDGNASPTVIFACDTAMDRLSALGFRVDELVGEAYDENMLVNEVHRDGGGRNLRISECLSPAVYFRDQLIKRAEVVTKGDTDEEITDC